MDPHRDTRSIGVGKCPGSFFRLEAFIVTLFILLSVQPVLASNSVNWRIIRDHWTQADEDGYGRFVAAIGKSGCSSSESCLRNAANPWANTDQHFLDIDVDCAQFPYLLRAYYAWKNGLPFSYVDGVHGKGDGRFSPNGNRLVSRHDLVDRGGGIDAPRAIRAMLAHVYSGTYRSDVTNQRGVISDFYSPAIQPGSIHPGTMIYDINGHVGLVYAVDSTGRIYYMGAEPDFTITRAVYGAQFPQSTTRLGGGFKNWRPLQLVGARIEGGTLVGGHIVFARNEQIPDFSLVQYLGTSPRSPVQLVGASLSSAEISDPQYSYNGAPLGFYEYVRVAVSGGRRDFNPIFELEDSMRILCSNLEDRRRAVDLAHSDGITDRPHPATIPADIYHSNDSVWESYATPGRDKRLRTDFLQLQNDLAEMINMWIHRDPRIVYDGNFLQKDLLKVYDEQSAKCTITYLSSDEHPVALSFDEISHRLPALSFDPYNCVELRWGDNRQSCPDGPDKRRWYEREQKARTDGLSDTSSLAPSQAPPELVDIRGLIQSMPARIPFVQPMPTLTVSR